MPYRRRRYNRRRKPHKRMWHRTLAPTAVKRVRVNPTKTVQRLGTSYGSIAVPFPNRLYTTFSYSEDITLTNTLAQVPAVYEFRGNGLYDPNKTGVGIQPRYFDTLLGSAFGGTAPYRRYTVLASKITLKIFGRNGSVASNPAYNGLFCITPQRVGVGNPSTITEMRERPLSKTVAVNSSQSWKPYKLTHFAKTRDMMARNDVNDPELKGTDSANPSNMWDWGITMCPVGSSDTGMSFDVLVSIKYYCMLDTLTDVADS